MYETREWKGSVVRTPDEERIVIGGGARGQALIVPIAEVVSFVKKIFQAATGEEFMSENALLDRPTRPWSDE